MILRAIISFIATVSSAVQAWFIFKDGKGFCFNDGCSIVERLTTVPPFYFFTFSSVFFLIVFIFSIISLIQGRKKKYSVELCINLFLTAAFAAEGVLLFFQYNIAHTFCSVCLIVFLVIVLLNITSGVWQFIRGIIVFASVLTACFSLQFTGGKNSQAIVSNENINKGTIALYKEDGNTEDILLIFSESCPHCEEVIDFLREESFCNVSFNPYEKMTKPFHFKGTIINSNYTTTATRNFMKSLGFTSFPLLVAGDKKNGIRILQGSSLIKEYVQKHCRLTESREGSNESVNIKNTSIEPNKIEKKTDDSSSQSKMPAQDSFIGLPPISDTCNDGSACM